MFSSSDLLIRSNRLVCPATGRDGAGSVAIHADRIVDAGPDVDDGAAQTIDLCDAVLLPGLIDLHAHPARSGSIFGIDPDECMLRRGVTTVLSQGDAGAANWQAYVDDTIRPSRTRVLMAINLSRIGETSEAGCFANLDDADLDACVAAIDSCREHVWGIAVNASHHACGRSDPRKVVRRGLEAARQTGLSILYGMRRPEDWSFEKQMRQLRPGDVVTYCFRRQPHCIVEHGRVHPAIREARERGILFDVGHGTTSFSFEVAERAIAEGFIPDTISTDLQRKHLFMTPTHGLPLVMSKLRAAGMSEADVFAAVTSRPAKILGCEAAIGSLSPGSYADLTVLQWHADAPPLQDCHGAQRQGSFWTAEWCVREGVVFQSERSIEKGPI